MSHTIDPRAEKGLLRIKQVLELIPVGKSTLWARVRAGSFPAPIKISDRTTAWFRVDVERFISRAAEGAPAPAGAPADTTVQGG